MTAVVAASGFLVANFETNQRQTRPQSMQARNVNSTPVSTGQAPTSSRRAYHPSELPAYLMAAIRETRMAPEHDHLNALMDDE